MEQARIGGQAYRWVNALILNGQTYGGGGNPMPDDLALGKTEYISYLKVSWWQGVYAFITEINIETTENGKPAERWTVAGAERQEYTKEPTYVRAFGKSAFGDKANRYNKSNVIVRSEGKTPVRILGLSGYYRSDALESLKVRYIDPYEVAAGDVAVTDLKNPLFGIMDVYTEGMSVEESSSDSWKKLKALKAISEFTATVETEVTAQYMMVEATSRFGLAYMNRQELDTQLETASTNSRTVKVTIDKGVVGVQACVFAVMKKSDGTEFLIPTNGASILTKPKDELKNMNFVDFTQRLSVVVPGIAMANRWGWNTFHKGE
jgi:hypothetical protein